MKTTVPICRRYEAATPMKTQRRMKRTPPRGYPTTRERMKTRMELKLKTRVRTKLKTRTRNELEAKDDDEEVMDDDEILNEEGFAEL
jgi:hypothetical protein